MAVIFSRMKVYLSKFNLIGHIGKLDLYILSYEFLKLAIESGMILE